MLPLLLSRVLDERLAVRRKSIKKLFKVCRLDGTRKPQVLCPLPEPSAGGLGAGFRVVIDARLLRVVVLRPKPECLRPHHRGIPPRRARENGTSRFSSTRGVPV